MTSGTSLATRLPAALVGVSLVSLLVAIIVAVNTGRELGQDLNDDRLAALQGSAAFDIASHMNGLGRTATALAASPQAAEALSGFTRALDELASIPLTELEDEARAVLTTHQTDYVAPLREAGRDVQQRDISTASPASIYLQYHYAVDLGVFQTPEAIDDAREGSAWSGVHATVHPVYREVVERLDLVDLYLVEPDRGQIVYSVRKRPDIGTSLDAGPFSGSVLATVADRVRDDPATPLVISDLSFYDPALLSPVGVVASPVVDAGGLAGVLVLMYDSTPITDVLTASGEWDAAGFPETAQTYLVGRDGTTRSEPRTFIENPSAHLSASAEAGLVNAAERMVIDASGSTVLSQRANDGALLAGVDGDDTVTIRSNLVGGDAFTTTTPVPVEGLEWFVISEVDANAAQDDLDAFEELLVVGTAVFIVALAFLGVAWANRTVGPIRAISERLASRDPSSRVDVPPRSPLEFHRLAESFDSMADALSSQHADIATARTARLDLLRQMLPPGVAARVTESDIQSLDEVPQATVVVLVVIGLADLVQSEVAGSDVQLLEDVVGELDGLAERHGLERFQVLGDAYFAGCGHDRPLIDHAPRAAAYALDARDAVRQLGSVTEAGLDVAVGIHTGPVTVGTTGGQRMLYDVWGATVSSAHFIARQAGRGQIAVSSDTQTLLPTNIDLQPMTAADDTVWLISGERVPGVS